VLQAKAQVAFDRRTGKGCYFASPFASPFASLAFDRLRAKVASFAFAILPLLFCLCLR